MIDDVALRVRNRVYARFADDTRAPTDEEVAADLSLPVEAVRAAMQRLHVSRALVLDAGGSIRMANPFSAVATPHRVDAGERSWHANCAWDAFGILAALRTGGHIASTCPDCGEPIGIDVERDGPIQRDYVFHVNVPAAKWWDDIVFT